MTALLKKYEGQKLRYILVNPNLFSMFSLLNVALKSKFLNYIRVSQNIFIFQQNFTPKPISCIYLKIIYDFTLSSISYHYQHYLAETFVTDVIVRETNIEILAILSHYFKLGLKTALVTSKIQEVK